MRIASSNLLGCFLGSRKCFLTPLAASQAPLLGCLLGALGSHVAALWVAEVCSGATPHSQGRPTTAKYLIPCRPQILRSPVSQPASNTKGASTYLQVPQDLVMNHVLHSQYGFSSCHRLLVQFSCPFVPRSANAPRIPVGRQPQGPRAESQCSSGVTLWCSSNLAEIGKLLLQQLRCQWCHCSLQHCLVRNP